MTTKAKRRAKVYPMDQSRIILQAIEDLKNAREKLRNCGCKSAADYVARALKSAEGAHRHATRMADEFRRDMDEYHEQRRVDEDMNDRNWPAPR